VPRRNLNEAVTRFWGVVAPVYDVRFLQRWGYRPAQDEVVDQLRIRGSQRIADIACGTGILADRIERELRPDEVYGVDMSEGMLAQARNRSSKVHWSRGPAEQLPFDDGVLDAVVTTSAFHFFDQPAALREFHRVLQAGGFAAVTTISPRRPLPLRWLTANRTNPSHYPSPAEMGALFEGAGFRVSDQHRIQRPAWTRLLSDLITVGVKD
jgi:ubiquinone/menaquinone biosynthesis C-methylase UbiE